MATWRDWLERGATELEQAGALDARLDCQWMACDALMTGLSGLRLRLDEPAEGEARETADRWLRARLSGLPLQYVQNRAHFMGHEFYVDERVLIPRQDTELLCECATELIRQRRYGSALDLCTGSGAVGISLQLSCPALHVTLADISLDALAVARRNAQALGVAAMFREGDLFAAVAGKRFDLIACNPPYINDGDMENLQKEVQREPKLALHGGADGLDFYRRIAAQFREMLNPGGALLVEVGYDQATAVAQMLGTGAFVRRDLGGIERVVGIIL